MNYHDHHRYITIIKKNLLRLIAAFNYIERELNI